MVPVVLRSLVPVDRHGGTFSGTIIGGNGREFIEQQNTFSFDVPTGRAGPVGVADVPGQPEHRADRHAGRPGRQPARLAEHALLAFTPNTRRHVHARPASGNADPKPGRWTFVVNVANPVGGQLCPRRTAARSRSDRRASSPRVAAQRQGEGRPDDHGDGHRPQRRAGHRGRVRRSSHSRRPTPVRSRSPTATVRCRPRAPSFLVPTQVDQRARGGPGESADPARVGLRRDRGRRP